MKRILISIVATIIGVLLATTVYNYRAHQQRLKLELQQTQKIKQELDNKLQEKSKETEQLKKQNDDLQIQLQAKKQYQAVLASVTRVQPAGAVIVNCGDNWYANYIYMHESGCRTNNPNGVGCDGIGQACPASKLLNPCGYDYACQNAWFNNYAKKYCYLGTGSGCWEGSYNFWLAHRWW